MSDKIFLGSRTGELETGDAPDNITRVNLSVDSDHYYTAGDDTGRAIEVTCPWGSQAMADSILASVSGKGYQPFTATDALLDPAAEIGDAVTVGGYYSVIADISTEFDRACAPTISAPESDEIDDEYPYESKERRETNRQLAQTRSLISKTSEEILLQVENELNGLSSSFSVQLESITGRIDGLDGEFSELSLTLDGLTVTDSSGTTLIKGSSIQTSTLYVQAANITGTLTANQVDLTGSITFRDLSQAVQDDIDNAYSMAQSAESTVSGWTYRSTTYIDGTKIMTGTVMASTLQGGEVEILDENESVRGSITIQPSAVSDDAIRIEAIGGLAMESNGGNLWLESGTGYIRLEPNTEVQCGGDFLPVPDDRKTLGFSRYRWTDVYATNGTIQTSDRRQKRDISYDLSRYGGVFDRLKPCSYRFQSGTRIHTGFVAQDLADALEAEGIPDSDCAAFIRGTDQDGTLGIRYTELIALLVDQVQKLKREIMIMKGASS